MDSLENGANVALISNLLSRFAQAADDGTLEEYGALMADDFIWESPALASINLEAQVIRGREQVLAAAQERRDAGIQGPGTRTRHVISNVSVIVEDRDKATSVAYWRYYAGGESDHGLDDGAPPLHAMGSYQDRFVRVDGQWLIAHRIITRL